MEKMLLRKYRPHDTCVTEMKPLRPDTTLKSQDNLIYTYEEKQYTLYKVLEVGDNDHYKCVELNIEDKSFSRELTLNFGLVGVFKDHGLTTIEKDIELREIKGKVVSSKGLLFTVAKNILQET